MQAVVVGLGSMGKRRIRILQNYFPEVSIVGVDQRVDRRQECQEKYDIKTSDNLDRSLTDKKVDIAFICTSPLSHHILIEKCLKQDVHVFTEINLVSDSYDSNMALAKEKGLTLFLSSTTLYRQEMMYVIDRVQQSEELLNYTFHVGQYLPDWHPWENFKDFFIGQKRTNGCREILAIQMPWLIKAFGDIESVQVMRQKVTKLNIDYPDTCYVMIQHKNGHRGVFIADVVCREPVCKLEIFGENIFLEWQGTADSLREKNLENGLMENKALYQETDKLAAYSKNIIENPYIEEVREFLKVLKGETSARYSFKEDLELLKWLDRIEDM